MLSEPIRIVAAMARVFERMGIPYAVAGSLASSVYGVPRATQDADIVADIGLAQAEALADALASDFFVDVEMIRDAIRTRSAFNVLHRETMFKGDVFIPKGDSWSREEMDRARTESLDLPDGRATIRFATPEDTLLHKIVWHKRGNEVSDRQWQDVLGILKIQGEHLDQHYLDRWATSLGVHDLLLRARRELGA